MNDFWVRRKAAVQAEEACEANRKAAEKEAETLAELEVKSDVEILRELELPDPEGMQAGDDFTAFLKTTVPERIRVRALRRLWTTNPVLANLDGLIEYGEDFTDAATVVENLQTTYRVGQGMLKHVQELDRAESGTESDEQEAEATESVTETDTENESGDKSDNLTRVEISRNTAISDNFSQDNIEESEEKTTESTPNRENSPTSRRRMRYSFDS